MIVTENNFMMLAIKNYDMKRVSSMDEFYDDMKRFQYIKRLFSRYETTKELRTRLILNHIIVIYNCLGPIATPMLFMKLEGQHSYLKPFLVFLNLMPETVHYEDKKLLNSEIPLDVNIVKELRTI